MGLTFTGRVEAARKPNSKRTSCFSHRQKESRPTSPISLGTLTSTDDWAQRSHYHSPPDVPGVREETGKTQHDVEAGVVRVIFCGRAGCQGGPALFNFP